MTFELSDWTEAFMFVQYDDNNDNNNNNVNVSVCLGSCSLSLVDVSSAVFVFKNSSLFLVSSFLIGRGNRVTRRRGL